MRAARLGRAGKLCTEGSATSACVGGPARLSGCAARESGVAAGALPPHSKSERLRYKPLPAIGLTPGRAQRQGTRRRSWDWSRENANKSLTRPRGSRILYDRTARLIAAPPRYIGMPAAMARRLVSTCRSRRPAHGPDGPRGGAARSRRIARFCARLRGIARPRERCPIGPDDTCPCIAIA